MSSNDELLELSSRVCQLEKSSRRHKRLATMFSAIFLAFIALGARKETKVRATAFELRDPAGRLRVEIALDDKGSPALNVLDVDGRPRVVLGMDHLGYPGLELRDSDGTERIGLGFDPDGSPTLQVNGKDGRERVVVGLDEHQNPLVNLFDEDGVMRSLWGLDKGTATLSLGNGIRGVTLSAYDDTRDTSIVITDGRGKQQLLLRGRDSGSPVVQLDHLDQSAVLDQERIIFLNGTGTVWASPTKQTGEK